MADVGSFAASPGLPENLLAKGSIYANYDKNMILDNLESYLSP
jgi:hypothetical protein